MPGETPEKFAAIARRVRNWGRWGPDDQIGTLNFIDAAARLRAAACVRRGATFALGLPLSEEAGIQLDFIPGRINPRRSMIAVNNPLSDDPEWICSSEDTVELATQCSTHWDALAHVSYQGTMYNGFPASSVDETGAERCGIHHVRTLVTRGILLDVARAKGESILEPGYPIAPEDLEAALEMAGVTIQPGDVLLVRTGQMVHLDLQNDELGPKRDLVAYTWPAPGLTMATAVWFHERDVAAVATDTLPFEVYPCEDPDITLPVHLLHLVEMGMLQGQNWVLDMLAADCANDGRYTFLLDATPLGLTRGLGSPLNPVAVK